MCACIPMCMCACVCVCVCVHMRACVCVIITLTYRNDCMPTRCPAERSRLEMYPLSKVKFGLRFQSFIFVSYPYVQLECDAFVCLTSEVTAECDRSCNNSKPVNSNGRKRRDVLETSNSRPVYRVFSPRIIVVDIPLNSSTGECL